VKANFKENSNGNLEFSKSIFGLIATVLVLVTTISTIAISQGVQKQTVAHNEEDIKDLVVAVRTLQTKHATDNKEIQKEIKRINEEWLKTVIEINERLGRIEGSSN